MSTPTAKAPRPAPPPLPRYVLPVLILILIGLVIATIKQTFYPGPPAAWQRLHEPQGLTVAAANTLLSDSGAILDSVKTSLNTTTETWNYKHRTGNWTVLVQSAKVAGADVIQQVQFNCYISNFPSLTRTWDYPPAGAPGAEKLPPIQPVVAKPMLIHPPVGDDKPPVEGEPSGVKVSVGIKK